jgi:hypothetical protein
MEKNQLIDNNLESLQSNLQSMDIWNDCVSVCWLHIAEFIHTYFRTVCNEAFGNHADHISAKLSNNHCIEFSGLTEAGGKLRRKSSSDKLHITGIKPRRSKTHAVTNQCVASQALRFPLTLCWSVFGREVEVECLACEVASVTATQVWCLSNWKHSSYMWLTQNHNWVSHSLVSGFPNRLLPNW